MCKVRFNRGGHLRVPWGYVGGIQCDPIEKKPFFHARPGALAFSFGMLGCDLHCSYCQNWVTSQALRDPQAIAPPIDATPDALVSEAKRLGARAVVSTYNEPLITSEWAVEIFKKARAAGLMTAYVSNGNGTPRVLDYLRPWVDLYKVDLKSFDDKHYRQLGGRIEPILDTIRTLNEMGIWVEIVTLLIPGFNNSDDEIERLTSFLAGVSPDIPWHVTAFHKDYRMNDPENTTPEMLMRAAEIGAPKWFALRLCGKSARAGRRSRAHAMSQLPGDAGRAIRLFHPAVPLDAGRACPDCGTTIPGRWGAGFDGQITSTPFLPGHGVCGWCNPLPDLLSALFSARGAPPAARSRSAASRLARAAGALSCLRERGVDRALEFGYGLAP